MSGVYKLRYDTAAEAAWDALPDRARDELNHALLRVCEDPYASTEPAHEDGDVTRLLLLERSLSVLVVIQPPLKRIRILEINLLTGARD